MQVYRGFAESDEFSRLCESYGIQRGFVALTEPMDQNEGVTKFVTRCYRLCLDRNVDTEGLNSWCRQILSGANTAKDAAYGFIFSQEFQGKALSDSDYVEVLYRVFMGREPDISGLQSWIKVLENGGSRIHVFNGFGDSIEFQELCSDYGIASGSGIAVGSEQFLEYQEGDYIVGKDIPAGEYVLYMTDYAGSYTLYSDSSGELGSIIENDVFDYNSIVTIKDGQYLDLSNCYAISIYAGTSLDTRGSGMFMVGRHIPAGEYRIQADGNEQAYMAVLSHSNQLLNYIVVKDNFKGTKHITVKEGQYLVIRNAHIVM